MGAAGKLFGVASGLLHQPPPIRQTRSGMNEKVQLYPGLFTIGIFYE